ncbi:hypothetical protein [Symmachiella dynata]|uniref:hypothetical protein n=1 Tax=Symmachiella dynata TaxID=2527995 RepID=UPI0011A270C7|nr:hypothetical protein [Symmachiella dynata]
MFKSNSEVIDFYNLNEDFNSDRWLSVSRKLTSTENKWRQAIRKERKAPVSAKAKYKIFVSPAEPYKCKVMLKQETKRFEIPQSHKNDKMIWNLIVDHYADPELRKFKCELAVSDIKHALGRDPNDSKRISTQINRFNGFWKTMTGVDAKILKPDGKKNYIFQSHVTVEDDPEDALQKMRRRLSK